jgi:uncharacterized membrane protein YfhO
VNDLVETENETEMIAQMKRQELTRTAIISGPKNRFISCSASHDDQVEVLEAFGGHLALETQNRARRFLVISEVWHPGWRAHIDGRDIKLYRTDVSLMGAWIPAGKHRVVLRFSPCYWPAAVGISALSGVVFLILLAGLFRKRWQTIPKSRDLKTL